MAFGDRGGVAHAPEGPAGGGDEDGARASRCSHDEPAAPAAAALGVAALPNERGSEPEDAFLLSADTGALRGSQLFAVFDGHGGAATARHCARRLHALLAERLAAKLALARPPAADVDALEAHAVAAALREAFVAADSELRCARDGGGSLAEGSGSTAVVALVTARSIWLAWAGDSRAVVVRGGAVEATDDHRPARADEAARIERAGGALLFNGGLRLMGVLAVTRAIGDHDLQPYGLTPEPEVLQLARTPEDEFLVLASDGLWDRVSPEEAGALAHSAWTRVAAGRPDSSSGTGSGRKRKPAGGDAAPERARHSTPSPCGGRACRACKAARVAASAMARCARSRRSRDDTTVVVVNLRQPCSCDASWAARAAAGAAAGATDQPAVAADCAAAAVAAAAAISSPPARAAAPVVLRHPSVAAALEASGCAPPRHPWPQPPKEQPHPHQDLASASPFAAALQGFAAAAGLQGAGLARSRSAAGGARRAAPCRAASDSGLQALAQRRPRALGLARRSTAEAGALCAAMGAAAAAAAAGGAMARC
ncbi:phosphatase 2C-like [Raphidocelis subcapitata]|uniref:protein-serine/threonine phosphatase n=1 Tax=Raphidocelis subcapitata TaxID=307507 RepID=A0A2V0PHB6_9CHLO|nr:phosphatase 2C-like [Raphidocelis subcapitata]|eukprot:GBF99156.1 phosphatase 2C-like [Raphidocelis subcapitata]